MKSGTAERTTDEILDGLSHVQRRKLLRALLVHNPQDDDGIKIDEDESTTQEIERLVEMNHVHLPKLENYGFIRWDQNTGEVSKGPNFDEIRPLLELLADHEDELPDKWL